MSSNSGGIYLASMTIVSFKVVCCVQTDARAEQICLESRVHALDTATVANNT